MRDPFEALTFRHPTRTATRIRYWFRQHWTAFLIGAAVGVVLGVLL